MNLQYTYGNWTIRSRESDTTSDSKALAIHDLDYAHDFSVVSSEANRVTLSNTTGSQLTPVERLRYTLSEVDNIFHGLEFPELSRGLVSKRGRVLIVEHVPYLSAYNSVTGEDLLIPMRAQWKLEIPYMNFILSNAIMWELSRSTGALFPTGDVTAGLLTRMSRGDLDPTR